MESYFARMLESQSSAAPIDSQSDYAMRLLQVAEVISTDDGELYARHLVQVLKGLETGSQESRHIFQELVQEVLVYIRNGGLIIQL